MKQFKLFSVTSLLASCLVITHSCSQTTKQDNSSVLGVFEATTPCDEVSKSLLQIPSATKCAMMKWNLTLYRDSKTLAPTEYKLVYTYGMDRQGTRGFMDGASIIEVKGKWTIEQGTKQNANAVIYKLNSDKSVPLRFLRANDNLLHWLDADKNLMVGTAAWSYTLNKINPSDLSSNEIDSHNIARTNIAGDSVVFYARTPCYEPLLALFGKPVTGCQLIKCKLVLYPDGPAKSKHFDLYTVHVGTGNNRYLTTGKWEVIQGTKSDLQAIIYQLKSDSGKVQSPLMFLKADDNILFMLDKDMNLMTGNDYCSYTFNRERK